MFSRTTRAKILFNSPWLGWSGWTRVFQLMHFHSWKIIKFSFNTEHWSFWGYCWSRTLCDFSKEKPCWLCSSSKNLTWKSFMKFQSFVKVSNFGTKTMKYITKHQRNAKSLLFFFEFTRNWFKDLHCLQSKMFQALFNKLIRIFLKKLGLPKFEYFKFSCFQMTGKH